MATVYYIDADNGNDSNDGLGTGGGNAWKTSNKYTAATLSPGDVGICRRNRTASYHLASTDMAPVSDGTTAQPITLEADYDDAWGDQVDLSGTATATTAFGSKTITFSADISGALAAGDCIYVSGDDNRLFAYEVDSVVTTTVTLYLPFKGTPGSGLTMFNMGNLPQWGVVSAAFKLNFSADDSWLVRGMHLKGTHANGQIRMTTLKSPQITDCVLEGNGSADVGIYFTSNPIVSFVSKTRFYNNQWGMFSPSGGGEIMGGFRDCLFDGNSVGSSVGVEASIAVATFIGTEFKNHATGDISITAGGAGTGSRINLRNCLLSSTTPVVAHHSGYFDEVGLEDYNGEPGDTRMLSHQSQAEGTPAFQSETGTTRAGGATIAVKVTGSDQLGAVTGWSPGRLLLFEIPFYATTDAKTYSVYFRPTATADWTADPIASELWIEAEYWNHATNDFRGIKKSTGVIDMNGSTTWTALTVAATPAQAGVLYLRGYYAKTKEAAKANTFYMDPIPTVA